MKKVAIAALVLLMALAGAWVWTDYRAWLALGPGGLPSDFGGWLTTTRRAWLEGRDGFDTARYTPKLTAPDQCAQLGQLPLRDNGRPSVGHWPVPHRQLSQLPTEEEKQLGIAMVAAKAVSQPDAFVLKKSVFEKHNDALFVRKASGVDGEMTKGEAGHMHPSDGSLHVILGAADAKTVIERGWGQAHPLAGRDTRPDGYVMIYAPRNEQERNIVSSILVAAAAHIAGRPCKP